MRMSNSSEVLCTVEGTKIHESPKAILFELESISGTPLEEPIKTWFPLSQIRKMTTDKNAKGKDTLTVTEWILKTKELI